MDISRSERIRSVGFDYEGAEKEDVKNCNLCGSDRFYIISCRDQFGFPVMAHTCEVCGLTFLNPHLSMKACATFYDKFYRPLVSASHGRLIDAYTLPYDQKPYVEYVANILRPYLADKKRKTLLDIGGSTGQLAEYFASAFGLKATVIDPAVNELKQAKERNIEAVLGFIETWDSGGRTFDLIGMFQTSDHLLDIASTLKKARSIISDKGIFIIDFQDFRAALFQNWSVEMSIKVDHIYSLTEATMEAYLLRAGFRPIRKAYNPFTKWQIFFICEPAEPQKDYLPDPASVKELLKDVLFIRNTAKHGFRPMVP